MMTNDELTHILHTAIAIAEKAGNLLRAAYDQPREINYKGDVDLVTQADHGSEQLILEELRPIFPEHGILAEETGEVVPFSGEAARDGLTWLIDPLDGTTNFAHGYPVFAVSVALHDRSGPLVGVVRDPMLRETFAAARGMGATCNGKPIRVSHTPDLRHALLATGFPYDRHTAELNNSEALSVFLRRSQGIRRGGAAALDMSYVACGRLDGFWEMRLHPWDVAAGILIVREAGGKASDYLAAEDSQQLLSGAQTLVSNGLIHAAMLQTLHEVYSF